MVHQHFFAAFDYNLACFRLRDGDIDQLRQLIYHEVARIAELVGLFARQLVGKNLPVIVRNIREQRIDPGHGSRHLVVIQILQFYQLLVILVERLRHLQRVLLHRGADLFAGRIIFRQVAQAFEKISQCGRDAGILRKLVDHHLDVFHLISFNLPIAKAGVLVAELTVQIIVSDLIHKRHRRAAAHAASADGRQSHIHGRRLD